MNRPTTTRLILWTGTAVLAGVLVARVWSISQKDQEALRLLAEAQAHLRVQPGTEQETDDYYARISGAGFLNFPLQGSTLDSLLAYLGYSTPGASGGNSAFAGLLAKDLELIPSFVLMPRNPSEFDALKAQVSDAAAFDSLLDLSDFENDRVLVSRFFAPKIATYYKPADPTRPVDPDAIEPGWRKLVRLTARSGSGAETAGVQHMYLLFNVKEADPEKNPFLKESANNQVILVPRDQDARDSAYFAVYGKRTDGYQLSKFLAADFDLPGHVGVEVPGAQDGHYFVPRSCAECHGHAGSGLRGRPVDGQGQPVDDFSTGQYRFAKPNYLDTDQWYDWMEFDFRGVTTSLNDVAFDGGKAHGGRDYVRAMDVFKKLNAQIRDQTFAAEPVPGVKSFQTLAAEKWIDLHDTDIQRAPYSLRSIGPQRWNASDASEMRLLRLLNNHCFRCHSSLIYNVFDRDTVFKKRFKMAGFLEQKVKDSAGKELPGFRMPQGRVLEDPIRVEMVALLKALKPQ